MNDLGATLERLGLSQYAESFIAEGFDTWETVIDITESDLDVLKVKLGHRRKLQRAIADSKRHLGQAYTPIEAFAAASTEGTHHSDEVQQDSKVQKKSQHEASVSGSGSVKRKYRRHPKPDEFAPERPTSAYVIFSNQMREALKPRDLSFTELAKVIGEKWQLLSSEAREEYELQAATAKEKYNAEFAVYKKTERYSRYKVYLAEFKAKQAAQPTETKRVKLEPETSHSARASSHGSVERSPSRQPSRDSPYIGPSERGSPPTASPSVSYSHYGNSGSQAKTSPQTLQSYSHTESPPRRQYSPMSVLASARTSFTYERVHQTQAQGWQAFHAPSSFNVHPIHTSPYERIDRTIPSEPLQWSRGIRPSPTPVPSLLHEEGSLSSESIGSVNVPLRALLEPDIPRTQRLLPKPVNSSAITLPTLDKLPPIVHSHHDPKYPSSSLAALLRAGDLAREAFAQSGSPG